VERGAFHVLARFTSARSSLGAASPSSGAYLQPHRRPRVLVTSATSTPRGSPSSRAISILRESPSTPVSPALRYGVGSAVPHSDEPIFRPVAIALYRTVRGYEERQRARKRLRACSVGRERKREGAETAAAAGARVVSGLDKSSVDRYALPERARWPPPLEEPRLSATRR
jgi:hypothetical protein